MVIKDCKDASPYNPFLQVQDDGKAEACAILILATYEQSISMRWQNSQFLIKYLFLLFYSVFGLIWQLIYSLLLL